MILLVLWTISWIGSILVAQNLGSKKGRKRSWLWGALLGWIGVLVVACLSKKTKLTTEQRDAAELRAALERVELRRRQSALNR